MVSDGVDGVVQSEKKKKAHVLLVTLTFTGHFSPFVQLLYHLAAKYPGLTVTVWVDKDRHADLTKLQRKGDFKSLDLRLEAVFGPILVFPEDPKFPIRVGPIVDNHYSECESLRKKLIAQKDAPGAPTSVVSDIFQCWAEELARELGVPWYTHYPGSPLRGLAILVLPQLVEAIWSNCSTSSSDRLITAIPSLASLPGLSSIRVGDTTDEIFHFEEFYNKVRESTCRATAVLINASEATQVGGLIGMRKVLGSSTKLLTVGPMIRNPGFGFMYNFSEPRTSCLDWLDSQRAKSVLYVAFGTLAMMSKESIMELAEALEASGVPFLWVLKLGSFQLSELVPPGFVERTKGRAFIETGLAPQSTILCHPSIGGFLTHCGWNSVMESMCAGVPFIAWPVSVDQPWNARDIADVAKLGFALSDFKGENRDDFRDISKVEVEKAVRLLMLGEKGGEVRTNIAEMQKALAVSVAEGGSSYQNLHSFLDEIANIRATETRLTC